MNNDAMFNKRLLRYPIYKKSRFINEPFEIMFYKHSVIHTPNHIPNYDRYYIIYI